MAQEHSDVSQDIELRDYQRECIELIDSLEGGSHIVQLPTGCHSLDTHLLMADGTTRRVTDIGVGDRLLGPDGTPRTVLQVHEGTDEMYRIIPNKGEAFTVTHDHILCLMRGDEAIDMPLDEYLAHDEEFRDSCELYRVDGFRNAFTVEHVGRAPYRGFTVDGDQRYLLDDFTVTHNCGKTAVFTHIPRHGRVLVLSHRDELVRQPVRFYEMQGVEVGIEKAEEHSHGEEVVSASVQTLRSKRLHESFKPGDFDMIITDECHHAAAPSYRAIYDYLKPRLHIGFTATPARNDDLALKDVFDDVIYQRDLEWGITKGWLCDLDCRIVQIDWDLAHVKTSYGDFQAGDLAREVNNAHYNEQIADAYRNYHVGPTMVFASSVGHAKALSKLIPRSAIISGKTKQDERNQILADFRSGKIECVVNCMVLTEGTDLPFVQTIVLARPTKSPTLYIQMVGRGLRPSPETGKEKCLLLDCEGVSETMDICTPADLLGVDTKGFGRDIEQGSLTELRRRVDDREDSPEGWLLRIRRVDPFHRNVYSCAWSERADGSHYLKRGPVHLEVSAPDQVGMVKLDAWDSTRGAHSQATCKSMSYADRVAYGWLLSNAAAHETRHLWDMRLVEQWGSAPASQKQMDLLRAKAESCGVRMPEDLTKYEASQLIDNFSERYTVLRRRAAERANS